MHGRGKAIFKDGHTYEGDMKNGMLNGKGVFTWKDGTIFKGKFRNNEITGDGIYEFPDGSKYDGSVKNGIRNGQGKYINDKEGYVYDGYWKNGLRHGQGKLSYNDNSYYEGEWKEGLKCGKGKYVYPTGNFYEGSWDNNMRHGQGTMNWVTSSEKYVGDWENDFQNGFGVHTWLEDHKEGRLLRNRYVGFWKQGMRHGKGVFFYSNGSKYVGEWKENMKDGNGTFTFEDGNEYTGLFFKDRMVDKSVEGFATITAGIQQVNEIKKVKQLNEENKTLNKAIMASQKREEKKEEKKVNPTTVISTQRARKDVENNPMITLLDLNDLLLLDNKAKETREEICKLILRKVTDLKKWYKLYSRNYEVIDYEEGFAMTLYQLWRFFRDCQLINQKCTIAKFDRAYFQSKKSHFNIWITPTHLTKNEKIIEGLSSMPEKSDSPFNGGKEIKVDPIPSKVEDFSAEDNSNKIAEFLSSSDEEVILTELEPEPEDIHNPKYPILQRQFYEGIVRMAYVYYSESNQYSNLYEKVNALFNDKLTPHAGKKLVKTEEEEKSFKLCYSIAQQNSKELKRIFSSFQIQQKNRIFNKEDSTILGSDFIKILKLANVIPGKISEEVAFSLMQKYYESKYQMNEIGKEGDEEQKKTLKFKLIWEIMNAEIIYHEMVEYLIIIVISLRPYAKKYDDLFKQFLNDVFFPQFKSFKIVLGMKEPYRIFPVTDKDKKTELKNIERKKIDAERKAKLAEERKRQAEQKLMESEDVRIPSEKTEEKKEEKEEEEEDQEDENEDEENGEEDENKESENNNND